MTYFQQSAKISSRQNFRPYGIDMHNFENGTYISDDICTSCSAGEYPWVETSWFIVWHLCCVNCSKTFSYLKEFLHWHVPNGELPNAPHSPSCYLGRAGQGTPYSMLLQGAVQGYIPGKDTWTDRQTQTDIHTYIHTDRQTDRQMEGHIGGQIDKLNCIVNHRWTSLAWPDPFQYCTSACTILEGKGLAPWDYRWTVTL